MPVVDCKPMKVHLDRDYAGFHVEVGEIPLTGEWVLQGTSANYRARVPILPEQRIKAYLHPCVFLPNADRFFRELKEGEVADESALPPAPKGQMHKIEEDLPVDASDPMDYCSGCGRSMLAHEIGEYCDNCSEYAS
jgi:hypothetical protein